MHGTNGNLVIIGVVSSGQTFPTIKPSPWLLQVRIFQSLPQAEMGEVP